MSKNCIMWYSDLF